MNECVGCGTGTDNPKFCTRSCAAKTNNKVYKKRTLRGKCLHCLSQISASRKFCGKECRQSHSSSLVKSAENKRCSICKLTLSIANFGLNSSEKDGLMRQCKVCNTERVKKSNSESGYVRKNWTSHGLTEEDFVALRAGQDNKCQICLEELVKPYIDHDHSCCSGQYSCGNCVRGLLCNGCNTGIGMLKDSLDNLSRAMLYLRK